MYIEVKNLSKSYQQKETVFEALKDVSFEVEKGEFICLLGPSGCGKSTLLNVMAGFEKAESGSVIIDGKHVTEPSVKHVTIFQNYGLLPWRTVLKNIELGLESKIKNKTARKELAQKYIQLVDLEKFETAHPNQLSGGMQQRVSIARALAVNPDILFMDEPFGALDAMTKIKLQNDIYKIAKTENKTVIFVTHDIEEAVYLADRIVVMTPNPGKIKTILNVKLPTDRDRTSSDFIEIRDRVFKAFDMKNEKKIEYSI